MHETTTDGVTTFWEQGPEPFSATLTFGVGARHETYRTLEVTHMVEHLVMATMPRSHLDRNARVDADTTSFYATGRTDEVVSFLSQVCAALTDLPMARMGTEAGVLDAEEGFSAHPALCWYLGLRFGQRGLGLLNAEGPGARQLTEAHVTSFVRRHFTRQNAVLTLTGPPPTGLSVNLPDGPRPEEVPSGATGLPLPALLAGVVPHPVLAVTARRGPATGRLARILRDRVEEDVRHEKGIAYDIDLDSVIVDANLTAFAVSADGQEDHAEVIAGAMWEALRALAQDGPTPEELAHDLAGFTAYTEDPRAAADWLEGAAYKHLHGEPVLDRTAALARHAGITAEDVRRTAAEALETAVVGLPVKPTSTLPALEDRTAWEPPDPRVAVRGERFGRRLVSMAPRDLSVVAGDAGLSITAQSWTHSCRWDDVVGVGVVDGAVRQVHLATGVSFPLVHGHLKNADRLFAVVDERCADILFEATK